VHYPCIDYFQWLALALHRIRVIVSRNSFDFFSFWFLHSLLFYRHDSLRLLFVAYYFHFLGFLVLYFDFHHSVLESHQWLPALFLGLLAALPLHLVL
jgi:hypothetical protein